MQALFHALKKQHVIAAALCVFFAFALQIQASFFAHGDYRGIRLNLADFGLPLAGVFILGSLLLRKSLWPAWHKPFGYLWPLLLTAILTISLLVGYYTIGHWEHWAVVNKFTGWFILMAYLGAGGWLATNFPAQIEQYFLKPFLYFFTSLSAACVLSDALKSGGKFEVPVFIMSGLMDNQNAFGLLLICVSIFVSVFGLKKEKLPRWFLYIYWLLFPVLVITAISRVLWVAVAVLLIFLCFYDFKKTLRIVLPCFLAGALLLQFMYPAEERAFHLRPLKATQFLYDYTQAPDTEKSQEKIRKTGDVTRIQILKSSYELWRQHPVTGGGLGSALVHQEEKYGRRINIIDNTIAWITAEMGITGLLGFMAAYIAMAMALFKIMKDGGLQADFAFCVFLFLLMFGLFSLVHEILYTRFLWFILGLGLALPKTIQKA